MFTSAEISVTFLTLSSFLLLAFALGTGVATFVWKQRKRTVLRNLELLISAEEDDYEEKINPQAKDIEDAFKMLFKARKQELQRMQQLENYRRDYIGNVAHELKTPLFSIQGYIESVLDDPKIDQPTLRSFLKKANKNAARLGQIVKDLDTITKFESGVLNIQKNAFDLGQLISEVIEELEIQASNKEISLFFQGKTKGIMVLGDRDKITQVLVNLGFNSIRYGKQGGTTNYKLSDTGEKIIVEVMDNGIGIPLQHQNRIFERFYRVDAHRNRETGGSGLGLSICKHIIDAHGEKIQVISTEGAGSVFSFALPKAK
ncbi:MAG: ATP-binding protein [Bacteroidia bacterium]|nr:ATP-binding protein [Bacteroidia bacterium]